VKIGDLVTLSRYGLNLGSIPWICRRQDVRLVGIITGIEVPPGGMPRYVSKNEALRYIVRWNDLPNLKGRQWYREYFFRNDLKYLK